VIQSTHNEHSNLPPSVHLIIVILVFGSMWGLSEVVLGGWLTAARFTYKAGLLTGIGMGLMGMALVICKKPPALIGMGLVTALVKLLAVPILHISVTCMANSCLAVFIEALAISLVTFLLMGGVHRSVHIRMAAGAAAGITAAVGFYFIGMRVAPCTYLLSFTPAGFLITEGLIWSAFSAVLFPLGYLAGIGLEEKVIPLLTRKIPLYYATASAVVVICWGVSAIAISSGL